MELLDGDRAPIGIQGEKHPTHTTCGKTRLQVVLADALGQLIIMHSGAPVSRAAL
jgi:hypothetical protein